MPKKFLGFFIYLVFGITSASKWHIENIYMYAKNESEVQRLDDRSLCLKPVKI